MVEIGVMIAVIPYIKIGTYVVRFSEAMAKKYQTISTTSFAVFTGILYRLYRFRQKCIYYWVASILYTCCIVYAVLQMACSDLK
jgi:hypothetical protein